MTCNQTGITRLDLWYVRVQGSKCNQYTWADLFFIYYVWQWLKYTCICSVDTWRSNKIFEFENFQNHCLSSGRKQRPGVSNWSHLVALLKETWFIFLMQQTSRCALFLRWRSTFSFWCLVFCVCERYLSCVSFLLLLNKIK